MHGLRIVGIFLAIAFLAFPTAAEEFHKQLSASERQHILDGDFKVLEKTEDMPASVKQAFMKITNEPSFSLANPGKKFQVTDVVIDKTLPLRRLVFAGSRDDEWFVHYERGGRGHGYCVLLFRIDSNNGLQFVWGGAGPHAKNLDELRKMVAGGQFDDSRQYYW
jgi:hypothetical protein